MAPPEVVQNILIFCLTCLQVEEVAELCAGGSGDSAGVPQPPLGRAQSGRRCQQQEGDHAGSHVLEEVHPRKLVSLALDRLHLVELVEVEGGHELLPNTYLSHRG